MLNMLLDLIIRLSIGVLLGCIIDYLVIKGHTGIDNKENYKNFMSNTSSIVLFCYIFVLFMCVHLFFYFVSTYIFADVFNTIYCMGDESELPANSNLENTGNKLDNEAKPNFIGVKDLNVKIPAESLPPVANALANGGIMAAAITAGYKMSSFMSLPTESSGNSAIDLLNILQYFHTLENFFVLCMGFYFIIMKLD